MSDETPDLATEGRRRRDRRDRRRDRPKGIGPLGWFLIRQGIAFVINWFRSRSRSR